MKRLLSFYSPRMPYYLVYMLQLVEYDPRKFSSWIIKLPVLNRVMHRGTLIMTKMAKGLLVLSYGFVIIWLGLAAILALKSMWLAAFMAVLLVPCVTFVCLYVTAAIGKRLLFVYRKPLLAQAQAQLKNHRAIKIAVLGSYGKTTMKELLLSVLSEGKRVKATPGNMNVPISHARWITSQVETDEEVLIFEYGEGEPGDITKFACLTQPQYAVITGLAPNHLDRYASLEALEDDLLSIRQYVDDDKLLMNHHATALSNKAPTVPTYSEHEVGKWKIENISIDYEGTRFTMQCGSERLNLKSQLLGRHQVGPLAAATALAHELGLNAIQIENGIAKTKPYEHRMAVRPLHGAWIIDDTYNGNLEGIRAGLRLMTDLVARRKIYVTPGLVDQGRETERVHVEIGTLIATANPDKVVLMHNSALPFIEHGLRQGGYNGEVVVEEDPLAFYTSLEHTVAAGDLLVMQNDWTDNYL